MIYAIALAVISVTIIILDHIDVMRMSRKHLLVFIIIAISIISLTYMIELQQDQKDKASSMVGVIESNPTNPLSTILFSTKNDNISAVLQLGTSGTGFIWGGPNGQPMLMFPEGQYITVSTDNGKLELSARLVGKNGLIAEIINNEWKVNPQGAWDRNFNDNTLEVKDDEGDVVLQIRLLNDRIQFQGIFPKTNNALLGAEGIDWVRIKDPTTGRYKDKIIHLFKYPSNNHLGELDLVREIKN
ncbi:MAG: hypothetical protein WBN94_13330 [Methanothrix sp.]